MDANEIKITLEHKFDIENISIEDDPLLIDIRLANDTWIIIYRCNQEDELFWEIILDKQHKCYVTTECSSDGVDEGAHFIRHAVIAKRTWDSMQDTPKKHIFKPNIRELLNMTLDDKLKWERNEPGDWETNIGNWNLIISEDRIVTQYEHEEPYIRSDLQEPMLYVLRSAVEIKNFDINSELSPVEMAKMLINMTTDGSCSWYTTEEDGIRLYLMKKAEIKVKLTEFLDLELRIQGEIAEAYSTENNMHDQEYHRHLSILKQVIEYSNRL